MRVDEITEKMKRYSDELKEKEGSLEEMTRNLELVKTRLKAVDDKLRQLRPGMRLDTLEERCKLLEINFSRSVRDPRNISWIMQLQSLHWDYENLCIYM